MILSIPLDNSGNPIPGSDGVMGFVSTVMVPEPSSITLLSVALASLGIVIYRQQRRKNCVRNWAA